MKEGEFDAPLQVDATVQTEQSREGVEEQAQTNGNLMPDDSRVWWERVRLIVWLLSYVVVFILGMCFWQTILSKLPNFRRYVFDEQSEVAAVTETEQGVLWTFVFMPVMTLFFNICIHTYKGVRSVPWLWTQILKHTSIFWVLQKIRQEVVKRAIVPFLKKCAVHFAKKCLVVMALLACVMLMIIGLQSVLEHYNFEFHLSAFVSHLRGAILCV